ncbi:spidroin-1-like [Macrobrachium rosenbergii]|uniref:spidroin-1-like n=1 Tax=Macrobrachium rosenbergii TaxID=79674 RepID=UPI0034D57646
MALTPRTKTNSANAAATLALATVALLMASAVDSAAVPDAHEARSSLLGAASSRSGYYKRPYDGYIDRPAAISHPKGPHDDHYHHHVHTVGKPVLNPGAGILHGNLALAAGGAGLGSYGLGLGYPGLGLGSLYGLGGGYGLGGYGLAGYGLPGYGLGLGGLGGVGGLGGAGYGGLGGAGYGGLGGAGYGGLYGGGLGLGGNLGFAYGW